MDFEGHLGDIRKDLATNEYIIEIRTSTNVFQALRKIKEYLLDVSVKKHRKKRSLNANAYYWHLIGELAKLKHLNVSEPYLHNYMLRRHPVPEMIGGEPVYTVIPATPEAEKQVDESETYHLKPTAQVKEGRNGKMYRTYIVLKGSHDYDTKEMSMLIDDAVQEAKEQGVETLPPDQIERMKQEWGIDVEQANESTAV